MPLPLGCKLIHLRGPQREEETIDAYIEQPGQRCVDSAGHRLSRLLPWDMSRLSKVHLSSFVSHSGRISLPTQLGSEEKGKEERSKDENVSAAAGFKRMSSGKVTLPVEAAARVRSKALLKRSRAILQGD